MIENILNIEEIKFLKELAQKRKTQEKDGCADPVYWMIQDEKNVFSDDGEYSVFFYDDGNGELYNTYYEFDRDNLEEFKSYILENFDLDTDDREALKEVDDNDSLEAFISMYDIDINRRSFTREHFITDMTGPFLTKESCKEHLKDNYYHYSKNARTYGMVGWRNPEFQKLMEIIEKFDNIEIGVDYGKV